MKSPAETPPNVLGSIKEALVDPCSLLDQPSVRRRMSGAFEVRLLQRCGRLVPPAPRQRTQARRAPNAATGTVGADAGGGVPQNGGVDILVNNPSLDQGGSTQSETTVVAHGSVVCAAWNDAGEGFGTNGFSGFGVSLDEGKSFHDAGPFPPGPGDMNFGDPSLAYSERDRAFYYAALSSVGLSLWRSNDDCRSFSYVGPIHRGFGDDKEMIAVDNSAQSPHSGRIYAGWTDFAQSLDGNVVSFSDDGGASWSLPANLPGSGFGGQGMWPAIAPNGDPFFALLNQSFDLGGAQDQWIFKGVNGGGAISWQKQTDIATARLQPEDAQATASCGRPALNGNIRNLSSPQIAIHADPSAPAGYVIHAVFPYDSDGAGPDHSNVFYRRSVDGALTWSSEVELNDDQTNTDQWFPALAADSDGTLAVSWYDRRLDPVANLAFDRFVTYSNDAGFTWTPNERVSDASSNVAQTNPNFDNLATCYHGDYDQIAVQNGIAHVLWSDDRRVTETGPNPDVYYDQVSLNPSLGRLQASPNPVSCDGTLQIRLADADLAGAGSQAISVLSTGGDVETLKLKAGGQRPGSFSGQITTAPGTPVLEDGVLQLAGADSIAVVYFDEDTGSGRSALATLDVGVDCVPPQIEHVDVKTLGGSAARVEVATSELVTLRVDYGFGCSQRAFSATAQAGSVQLESLALGASYFFSVTATDRAGNSTSDDNGGNCYTFTTPSQVFLEDFEEGLGGFTIDNASGGGHGLWHLTQSCASAVLGHTKTGSLYYGQDATCTYDSGSSNEGAARSPVVALDSTAGAAVEFDYYLGTEGGGFFDQASVAVSVNGGPFQIAESNFSALLRPDDTEEGELAIRVRDGAVSSSGTALADNSGHWQRAFIDLAPVLTGLPSASVQLEFRFATFDPGANAFAGFYVDDVRIVGTLPPLPCTNDADCDDGLFCNGRATCVSGACKAGIPVVCAPDHDGLDCTEARCDEASQACVSVPNDARCDDGLFCDGFEVCDPVAGCRPGTPAACNDGLDCTADQCREDLKSCFATPQSELCQDGVFCNGFEICDRTLGCIPGPFPCDDSVACTQDVCNEELVSCENTPLNVLCDDGLFCNGVETCDAGLGCLAGSAPCLAQSCNEAQNQCAAQCFTSTNGEHVKGSRAQFLLDTVYLALGSEDFLGVEASEVTSLQGGGDFWERVDSCPEAPVITSLTVRVVGDVAIVSGTATDANADLESVVVTFNIFGLPLELPAEGTSEFTVSLPIAFSGQYFVSAQAFDRRGFKSDPSAPVSFDVLPPAPPKIDSISVAEVNGATEIQGQASDPNGDIERVVVTVLQGGQVVTSGESGAFDPYSVDFNALAIGSYTARAQAFDASGLASTLSQEVAFDVVAGSNLQCFVATNAEHQAAERATALFGDTFFFAVGSNDFLGVGSTAVTALRGSGSFWQHVDSCDAKVSSLPPSVLIGPVRPPTTPVE